MKNNINIEIDTNVKDKSKRDFMKKAWKPPMFIMLGLLAKEPAYGASDLGNGNGQGGGWGPGGNPKNKN